MPRSARNLLATGAIAAVAISGVALASSATGAHENARARGFVGKAALAKNALAVKGVDVSRTPAPGKLLPLDANGKVPFSILPLGANGKIPGELIDAPTLGGKTGDQIQASAVQTATQAIQGFQAAQASAGTNVNASGAATVASMNLPSAGVYIVNVHGNISVESGTAGKVGQAVIETSSGSQTVGSVDMDVPARLVDANTYEGSDVYSASYLVNVPAARTISVKVQNISAGSSSTAFKAYQANVTAIKVGTGTGATTIK